LRIFVFRRRGEMMRGRVSLLTFLLLLMPRYSYAMHISEGILPYDWAIFWFLVALPFVGYGIRRLSSLAQQDISMKPLVGLMTAVVFIISCMPIPVPTAGTCSHPVGTGISSIILGPSISILITAVALLIQALFLAHGGLSTWGADIVSMGIVGSLAAYGVFKLSQYLRINLVSGAFLAGLLADWCTYITTSVELAAGIRGEAPFFPLFYKILVAFIPTQLPLGLLEGVMTAGVVSLLAKKRPDLLIGLGVIKTKTVGELS